MNIFCYLSESVLFRLVASFCSRDARESLRPSEKELTLKGNKKYSYLKDVDEEVGVEVRPVVAADVDDEFDEFVADEGGHRVLIGQKQLAEHGAHLQLVFADETNPLPIDDVLQR